MQNLQKPKQILCIHDLSGAGRSSLCAILPVLAAMGHQPIPLPTALLSTHTGGLGQPAALNTDAYGPGALRHYQQLGFEFDCIYTGYLASEAQLMLAEKAFELWPNALKVTDPVMGDGGKLYTGLSEQLCQGMKRLCEKADLVVPNLTEACYLLGEQMPEQMDKESALALVARLSEKYPAAVVTGLPMDKMLGNAGAQKNGPGFLVQRIRIGCSYPGTGDLFASVLVGALMGGNALSAAVDLAAGFVAECIAHTPAKADPRLGVWLEPQLYRLMNREEMAFDR